MKQYVLDTNILIESPDAIFGFDDNLYTKRLGYFAVAGGGGGATLLGNGNAANSGVYRADNAGAGENGMAGGGGGWIGGQKGTAVLHHHKENCLGTRELTRTKTQVHNSYRDDDDNSQHTYKSRDYYWLHRDENGVIKRYVVNNGSKDYVPTPSANMRGETSSSSKRGTDFWNTTSYSRLKHRSAGLLSDRNNSYRY